MRTVASVQPVTDPGADVTRRMGDAALGTVAAGVALLGARAASVTLACPLQTTTGFPCPGCGMTRLADAVVRTDVSGAISHDPIGAVVLLAVATLALVGVAGRLGVGVRLPTAARLVPAGLLVALGVRWALLLAGSGPDIG